MSRIMDLEDHGKREFAFRFLNDYLELTGDYSGLLVLRYYLAYRALVRAKIASIGVTQRTERDSQSLSLKDLERYLQLDLSYMITIDTQSAYGSEDIMALITQSLMESD